MQESTYRTKPSNSLKLALFPIHPFKNAYSMKVLLLLCLLSASLAVCNLRTDCTPAFLQQQPQASMNPMTLASDMTSAVSQSINQVMGQVFNRLYGEEEGGVLMNQLQVCERTRTNSLLGASMRMTLLSAQFLTLCNQQNPDPQANRLFSQVLNIVLPLVAPCNLDRDIAADLVVAQMMVIAQVRQSNATGFEAASQAVLNMTGQMFSFNDNMIANFSNSLQSLADRNLLDENQVPLIIDLMQNTVTQTQQIYQNLLSQMPDDPQNSLTNAQNAISDLEQSMRNSLSSLQVPDADIQNLSDTLNSITSEMTSAFNQLLADPTDTDDASSTLSDLTSQLTSLTQENAQIFVDLISQNVDEFCSARSSASTNST